MNSMAATGFVDSTTLLYTLDRRAPEKAAACIAWLRTLRRSGALTMSLQTLNEAYAVVSRKAAFSSVRPHIRAHLTDYALFATAPLGFQQVGAAWAFQDQHGVA